MNNRMMEQIMIQFALCLRLYPHTGVGMCLFTAVQDISPALADKLRWSDANPLHDDGRVPQALKWLSKEWAEADKEREERGEVQ